MKNEILIIDGKNLLWRTSDAFKDLSVEVEGEEIPTGGIYGFLSMLIKIYQKYGGKVVVAWEGKNNFRFNFYPDYKKREEPDEDRKIVIEEINDQLLRLKSLLRAMGVDQYCGVDCEADDAMCRLALDTFKDKKVLIYTRDSDLRQLVNERVKVVSPGWKGKDIVFDEEKVIEKHGVKPKYISDLKALAGDSSDNIPGIKGIGSVMASKLINEYGDVYEILRAALSMDKRWPISEKFIALIATGAKDILLYKMLTILEPIRSMKKIKPKKSQKNLVSFLFFYKISSLCAPFELKTLMTMGGKNEKEEQREKETQY